MRLNNLIIAASVLIGISLFTWPLFIGSDGASAQAAFVVVCPMILAVIIGGFSSGVLGPRQIATLAVVVAVNSAVRMLGAGFGGIETVFFLIVIAGFVFGAGFGFLTGVGSLFASALLTGGIGPWLPFQMLAAGLVGIGAGLLPSVAKKTQSWLLAGYAVIASYLYGALMTMWNWPYLGGRGTSVSFVPGAGPAANLGRFFNYELVTGGLLWDTGRAITTAVLVLLTARTLQTTLERAARRANINVSSGG